MHEFYHALGAWHEQARYDRDTYVTILTDNIIDGKENNFAKKTTSQMNLYSTQYSFESIMHYGGYVSELVYYVCICVCTFVKRIESGKENIRTWG